MVPSVLDDIDKRIVYALQEDARNSTTTDLASELGVAASTVSNRISQLEADGIVSGYRATVDYERAGFPLHVQIVCTAPIHERQSLAEQALDIPGVVQVSELMLGEGNVRVEAVGKSNDDLTRVATALNDLGLSHSEKVLVQNQFYQPLDTLTEEDKHNQPDR